MYVYGEGVCTNHCLFGSFFKHLVYFRKKGVFVHYVLVPFKVLRIGGVGCGPFFFNDSHNSSIVGTREGGFPS